MVAPVISICMISLSKYLSFTFLGNGAWLNIVNVVVAAPIIPAMGCLVVYSSIDLQMSSIAVTTFCGRLIDGCCVTGPVPGLMFPDPEVSSDMGNGSSEMF